MRLFSPSLENIAVKTILTDERLASYILPRLAPDFFGNEPSREIFQRIQSLSKKSGSIPEWNDLVEDPVLSEDTRDYFKSEKIRVVDDRKSSVKLVAKLNEYRKARILFRMSKSVAEELKKDKVDIDAVSAYAAEQITKSRVSTGFVDQMINVGGKKTHDKLIRQILLGKKLDLLPTGIKAFDDMNGGIPRGAVHVIAATSGAGKSVMALNIAMARALLGLRVCIISLEMEVEEIIIRMMSKLSNVDMKHFLRAQHMSDEMRTKITKDLKKFWQRVQNNGGMLSIIAPEEDMTLEDLMLGVRPFGFDDITVDYLGLTRGMDGADQWQKMGAGVRFAKRYSAMNKSVSTILAQLGDDGNIRYSKMMQEHASNMWTWVYTGEMRESKIITVKQPKARNQKSFDFMLQEQFEVMTLQSIEGTPVSSSKDKASNVKGAKGKRKPRDETEGQAFEM